MKIINNISKEQNHDWLIKQNISKSDHLIFVSPFLYDDFSGWIEEIDFSGIKTVELVTSLGSKGKEQLLKPKSLISFYEEIKKKNNNTEVLFHLNNKLHGKIYLFKSGSSWMNAIITSANLTNSGLKINDEWGIIIEDFKKIEQLYTQIYERIEYKHLPSEIIYRKLQVLADQELKKLKKLNIEEAKIDIDLLDFVKKHMQKKGTISEIIYKEKTNFFLKPFGTAEDPILSENKQKFGDKRSLRFPAKNKNGKNIQPKNIKPNDVIITFGTGSRCVISINTVTTNVEETDKKLQEINKDYKRWPWSVNCINHTPKFADEWWVHNITIDELREDFLSINPGHPDISFGTFNFGAGSLKISKKFAKYIIDTLQKLNKS